MARLIFDNISSFGTSNPITFADGSTTTGSWTSSPPFPSIASGDYAVIVCEPDTVNAEIVYLDGPFTAGDTSSPHFTRAQEGTTGIAHAATQWLHGPTVLDFFPGHLGSGSPEGVITANFGEFYLDISGTTIGLYQYLGTSGQDTGWFSIASYATAPPSTLAGGILVSPAPNGNMVLVAASDGTLQLSDVLAQGSGGSGNSLQWINQAGDGAQEMSLFLGALGAMEWDWLADGHTNFPGSIATVPTDSHTATTAFNASPLAIGTPLQSPLSYDVEVNVVIAVSAAVGGSLNVGVGPSATPTVDPLTPALSGPALVTWSGVVPKGYYLSFTTTGTITAGTPVVQVTPL